MTGTGKTPQPPRLAVRLLRRSLPPGREGATIEADLHEDFVAEVRRSSARRARRRYWRDVWSVSSRYAAERQKARLMDMLWHDFRHAVRSLRAARGFTITTLLTLALSIGAATAIFAVVNAMLVRPLPFKDASQLVWSMEALGKTDQMTLAWPNFLDWQARQRVFSETAGTRAGSGTLTGAGDAVRLDTRMSTWNFLHMLGVEPVLGRGFTESDAAPGAARVALVSDNLWRTRLGGAADVLGKTITLDGQPLVVIGVLPPRFRYFRQNDVWPIMSAPTMGKGDLDRGNHVGITLVGRLKDGLTVQDARADLLRIAGDLEREYPATNSGNGATVMSLTERFVGDITPTLRALFGAVGVLLLLACVNIANLLVARGASRAHELSVRAALGCGRFRMARQLIMENIVIAAAGGALGLAVGGFLLNLFLALIPADTPRIDEVRFSLPVFLFGLAVAAGAALVFGVLPAAAASRARAQEALVRSSREGQTASQRVRRGLMTLEVALALVLLIGAGLMGRTLYQMWSVDPGFNPDGLLSIRMSLEGPKWTDDRLHAFYQDLLLKAKAVPGVKNAALSIAVPLAGGEWGSVFTLDDRPVPPRAEIPSTTFCPVSADYFATLGLRLVRGRTLTAEDGRAGAHVAVVNARFAKRFWPDGNALGKRVKQGWPEWTTPWWEIVGVVDDVRENGVTSDPPMQVYLPIERATFRTFALIARTDGDPRALSQPLQSVVHSLDADLPVFNEKTIDDLKIAGASQQRLSIAVIGAFGLIAVLVACVGLYGVVSHGVVLRNREIGLRMALGATAGSVLRLFVLEGLATAGIGVALGLGGAYLASGLLESLLFRVRARDAATFAGVSIVLLAVALVACYLPARKAARVSPSLALRGES